MTPALTILGILLAAGVAVAFARRRGRRDVRRERTRVEDALKHMFDQEYRGRLASFASLGGVLRLDAGRLMQLLARMQELGLVRTRGQEFKLTPEGERGARQVVRAHRLLERYFADELQLPLADVHAAAERKEHALTRDEIDALDASLGHPRLDPHGDPIPNRDGALAPAGDTPLTDWPSDVDGRIVHLEDEPDLAYAQILAEGLRVGQIVRVLEATPERLVLTDGDTDFRLAPAVAANVFVAPAPARASRDLQRLSEIPQATRAEVVALDDACQGFSRRRLMDLGFTPGARLAPALDTFAGDPRGYRIRGTLVALRRDQARHVLVRLLDHTGARERKEPA